MRLLVPLLGAAVDQHVVTGRPGSWLQFRLPAASAAVMDRGASAVCSAIMLNMAGKPRKPLHRFGLVAVAVLVLAGGVLSDLFAGVISDSWGDFRWYRWLVGVAVVLAVAYAVWRAYLGGNPVEHGTVTELVIADDGSFVGGDLQAASGAVQELLAVPVDQRWAHVRVSALENRSHRLQQVSQAVKLRRQVAAYERAIHRMMSGAVHFSKQWDPQDLATALVELRGIYLPGSDQRQIWQAWPADDPARVARLRLDAAEIELLNRGSYVHEDSRNDLLKKGLPRDRPVWLTSVPPKIVWGRVVPAVVAGLDTEDDIGQRGVVPEVDLTDWVLSSGLPADLKLTRPEADLRSEEATSWSW